MNKKTKNIFCFFIFLISFIFITFKKYPLIKTINYNQDEIDYVGNSFLLKHYSLRNINQDIWNNVWAYDQPHLYHYLIGLVIENKFNQPLLEILRQNNFHLRYPGIHQYMVIWNNDYTGNFFGTSDPTYHLITYLRQPSFCFYIVGMLLISLTSYVIFQKTGLLLSLIFYLLNDSFANTLIPATSDALLFLLFNLSFLLWSTYLKHKTFKASTIFFIQSIISGLALSTKLNGGILIILSLFFIIYLVNKSKIKIFLVSIVIPIIIFEISNPYILLKPFTNLINMIQWRFYVNYGLSQANTNDVIPNIFLLDRIYLNSGYTFCTNHFSLISILLVTIIFILNTKFIIETNYQYHKEKLLIPMFFLFELICLSYISIAWPRYYTPLRLALYFNVLSLLYFYKEKLSYA